MYKISCNKVGSFSSISLMPLSGYYVSNVDGLTGISTTMRTVQNINGAGESIVGGTKNSKTLTIKGLVLDGNTSAKQDLINFFAPLTEIEVLIWKTEGGQEGRDTVYRKARCFVKTSPIITQTKHSVFTISLAMPMPYWTSAEPTTFTLSTGIDGTPIQVAGDIEPDYELTFTVTGDVTSTTLYVGSIISGNYMQFDAAKLPAGKLVEGDVVRFYRDNGRIRVNIDGTETTGQNGIAMVYTDSTLWRLPLGLTTAAMLGSSLTNIKLSYYPHYSGVLVDGV